MAVASQKSTRILELDGLRGIAVLLVLINHFNKSWLPGGFIGVDVFFALSGYVVSRSVLQRAGEKLGQGLVGFYKRRFVRILPALVICVLLTTLLSVLFIPRSWLSQSLEMTGRFSIVGASNIAQILTNDGYFAPTSEFNPFTHTWSLGIEEQFYILIPIFLILLRPKAAGWLIGLLSSISLVLAISWSVDQPSLAFYSLFSRFWELGVGVLLAITFHCRFGGRGLINSNQSDFVHKAKNFLPFAGILMILYSSIFNDSSVLTPWPGSVLPVLGTGLIIVYTFFENSIITPFQRALKIVLMNKLILWLGVISYALYLWHWPVVVLMKWTVGLDNAVFIFFGIALSLLLACLSTYLIEKPFAKWSRGKTRFIIIAGLSSVIGGTFLVDGLFQRRSSLTISTVNKNAYDWFAESPLSNGNDLTKRTLFVLGNSHALAYAPLLEKIHQIYGWNTKIFPLEHCTIGMILHPANSSEACQIRRAEVFDSIQAEAKNGDVVWFASLRMPRYVDQWGPMAHTPLQVVATDIFKNNAETATDEMRPLIADLQAKNLTVLIDRPKPVFKSPPFRCQDWFNRMNSICNNGLSIKRSEFEEGSQYVNAKISELSAEFPELLVWDPAEVLCDQSNCNAMYNGNPVFFDADHLSRYGNLKLVSHFKGKIADRIEGK